MNESAITYVPQLPWYGDTRLRLEFPSSWKVYSCNMRGYRVPRLSKERISRAFSEPLGTPRISELARGKKEVAIIFDDLSRPTKVFELVPFVLRELGEAGIGDKGIRFIAALGAHGAMKYSDFVKKLGTEVPARFSVYNHNPYENCTYLGKTSRGTPVSVNNEVMACDLKIALGCVTPHPLAGFGGGGKAILPGVAGIDSIWANHHFLGGRGVESGTGQVHSTMRTAIGQVEGNPTLLDIEEAARMAGLDIIVNALVNTRRDTIALFVGDVVIAHKEACKLAVKIYATERPEKADVVVANAYCKANEGIISVQIGNDLLKEEGGDLVVICNTPDGQICHYLSRSFGKNLGGRLWSPRLVLPPKTKRIIALGPYIDRAGMDWMGPSDMVHLASNWKDVLAELRESNGDGTRVAVIPDTTIQYFPGPEGGHQDSCDLEKER